MFSLRSIAGFGAAALVFLALSKIGRSRPEVCEKTGEYVRGAARRVEGIIHRRGAHEVNVMDDVI
ncbi:MAG: hypothetical protein ACOX86_00535 [Pelotomaculaceae bacterium]|jgi:hypothetical protein|nr:hypothetical protein [Bacillota bacterium]HHU85515.1 hypothetical protein [Peptococcaceae bacterium]